MTPICLWPSNIIYKPVSTMTWECNRTNIIVVFSYNSLFVMNMIEQNFIFNGKIGKFPYIVCNYTLELNLLQISHRYTIKNTFNFDYRYKNVHLYICLQLEFLYILQSAVKWYEWKLIINIWHSIRIVKKNSDVLNIVSKTCVDVNKYVRIYLTYVF